ncbi:MAG: hemerythrin domain-containing protein [Candidatus Thiodiazotropha sp. L084R]
MNTINELMKRDHLRCDEIFIALEQSIHKHQWQEAIRLCATFTASMEYHFKVEEEILFPALLKKAPQVGMPVDVMLVEHEQMRHLISQLATSLDDMSKESATGFAETLLVTMQQHNTKEERVLYAMADSTVPHALEMIGSMYSESA